MIRDIKERLERFAMKDNDIYDIIEVLYDENNKLYDLVEGNSIKEKASEQFELLIKGFSKIHYPFSFEKYILSDSNLYQILLYNYMMFRLKYDIKIENSNEIFLSDYIKMIINMVDLDLQDKEIYYIYTFNKNMSLDKVFEILKDKLNFDFSLKITENINDY